MDCRGETLAELLQVGSADGALRRQGPRQKPQGLAYGEPRGRAGQGAVEAGEGRDAFASEQRRRERSELRFHRDALDRCRVGRRQLAEGADRRPLRDEPRRDIFRGGHRQLCRRRRRRLRENQRFRRTLGDADAAAGATIGVDREHEKRAVGESGTGLREVEARRRRDLQGADLGGDQSESGTRFVQALRRETRCREDGATGTLQPLAERAATPRGRLESQPFRELAHEAAQELGRAPGAADGGDPGFEERHDRLRVDFDRTVRTERPAGGAAGALLRQEHRPASEPLPQIRRSDR